MSSTSARRVLVAGASIAGPAFAHWMSRGGWDVTVLERAPEPRSAGQNVDVRGAGREVLRRMGLDEAALERTTGEVGTVFLDLAGNRAAEFPAQPGETGGATAELEILRGDLSDLLVASTRPAVEYRYGCTVVAVEDRPDDVVVHLSDGTQESFDLVVAADGLNSATRTLFGSRVTPKPVGLETTYFTIPRTDADDDWWRWYNAAGGGRSVQLRPDNHGSVRATLNLLLTAAELADPEPRRSRGEQIAHLHERFADAGWETPRILAGLDGAADVYYEQLGQVRTDRWSQGRRVLIGDAAWCASPLSGMGTTLALVGAYVTAAELTRGSDHTTALADAEALLRPYVQEAQKLPPGAPRMANPKTELGVAAFVSVLRLAAAPPVRRLTGGLTAPPADRLELPEYPHLPRGPVTEGVAGAR